MLEHVSAPISRVVSRRRPRLAPLAPDAFLRWAWLQGPRDKGTQPLTLEDVWFELAHRDPEITRDVLRRDYVRIAAKVRRNQRVGVDVWGGI